MIEVQSRTIVAIDWFDTGDVIPHDDPNAVRPSAFDYNHGAYLEDYHSFVPLRGFFELDDLPQDYDPLRYAIEGQESQRLQSPHRFYLYHLDTEPIEPVVRATGWCVVDVRPSYDKARFRMAGRYFEELQREIPVPVFNSSQTFGEPDPPRRTIPRRTAGPRILPTPSEDGETAGLVLGDFNEAFTRVSITINTADVPDDTLVYYDFFGVGSPLGGVVFNEDNTATIEVNVQPNSFIIMAADLSQSLAVRETLGILVPDLGFGESPENIFSIASVDAFYRDGGHSFLVANTRWSPLVDRVTTPQDTIGARGLYQVTILNSTSAPMTYMSPEHLIQRNSFAKPGEVVVVNIRAYFNYTLRGVGRVFRFDRTFRHIVQVPPVPSDRTSETTITSMSAFIGGRSGNPNQPTRAYIRMPFTGSYRGGSQAYLAGINRGESNRYQISYRPIGGVFANYRLLEAGILSPNEFLYELPANISDDTSYEFRLTASDEPPITTTLLRSDEQVALPNVLASFVPEELSVEVRLQVVNSPGRDIYWRFGREGRDTVDQDPIRVPSGNNDYRRSDTLEDLYPNRNYFVEYSFTSEFAVKNTFTFSTDNFAIGGVRDPSLTFDQSEDFWRGLLDLPDLQITTGELPAGYIQRQHSNLDGLPEEVNAGVTEGKTADVRTLGRQLASKAVAGVFELSNGSFEIVSKTLWRTREVFATLRLRDFYISEYTRSSQVRENLAVSEVVAQVHTGTRSGEFSDDTTVLIVPVELNNSKKLLGVERKLDLSRLFTSLTVIPGWSRENIALVAEQTPVIVEVDVQAMFKDSNMARCLHDLEPSYNLSVELPYGIGNTALFTGTLMRKRVSGGWGKVPKHRLSIWVHTIQPLGLDILRWDVSNWNEGVWG